MRRKQKDKKCPFKKKRIRNAHRALHLFEASLSGYKCSICSLYVYKSAPKLTPLHTYTDLQLHSENMIASFVRSIEPTWLCRRQARRTDHCVVTRGRQYEASPTDNSYGKANSIRSTQRGSRSEQLEPHRSAAATGAHDDEMDEDQEEFIPWWLRRLHQASTARNKPHAFAADDTGEEEPAPSTAEPTAAQENQSHRQTRKGHREQKNPPPPLAETGNPPGMMKKAAIIDLASSQPHRRLLQEQQQPQTTGLPNLQGKPLELAPSTAPAPEPAWRRRSSHGSHAAVAATRTTPTLPPPAKT